MTTRWLLTVILLFGLLLLSIRSDLKERKILNKVTVSFAAVGLLLNTAYDVPEGFLIGLAGLTVGLLIFMVPYLMHGMGAGDLKLMAAIGALTNWHFVIYVALITALAGGVIALVYKAIQGGVGTLFKNIGKMTVYLSLWLVAGFFPYGKIAQLQDRFRVVPGKEKGDYIPYSVAIGIGALGALVLQAWGRILVV